MSKERLIYLPLGGAGEIGMNAYVYGWGAPGKERLIVVDLGVTFPDMDGTPGVDLIYPDITWLAENRDRLDAIFVTHAHEDHVGGVGRLWSQLQVPVYCRRFTAIHARRKLEEAGQDPDVVEVIESYPMSVKAAGMDVSFLPVSHSIPEASGLVIDTPAGRVVHTGDFKLDPNPMLGEAFDEDLWRSVAGEGVHALVCDSTNVFSPNPGRSESSVAPEITKLVAGAGGMVVATTFASNIARVQSLAMAGRDAGRSICLMGRAMQRMVRAGIEAGVVTDFPSFVAPEEAGDIPRENLMLIVTGSQGERRAASAQLARGRFLGLSMKEGDMFLFSSKTIPGNEVGVARIMNAFSEMGVDVVDDAGGLYHVSGHANRPDLERVHEIMTPGLLIPMHGEHRHLREHVKLAESKGLAAAIVPNGTMVALLEGRADVVEHVETGRVYLDGSRMIGALDGVVRDRMRMALNGLVVIGLILEDTGEIAGDAWAEVKGLAETGVTGRSLTEEIEESVNAGLERASKKVLRDDAAVEELARRAARKTAQDEVGKKPEVIVLVSRLEG